MIVRASIFVVVVVGLAACVDATNPFDPETPGDRQAPAVVHGVVRLDDASAPADALAAELAAVRVQLLDDQGLPLTKDGQNREVPLVDVDGDHGTFVFDGLVPGTYAPRVQNVGARYIAPAQVPVHVGPGADVDLGELRFVRPDTVGGGGPGLIDGEVRLVGADGGARTVSLYRLPNDGGAPERVLSKLTDADGKFEFAALPIGTYSVVAELSQFTPDYAVDLDVGETGGAALQYSLSAADALTLHPVTAVLEPVLPLVEGERYTSADQVDVEVLAFGGVTGMRIAVDASFLDDAGAPLPFVPFAALATVQLPDVEGPISIYAQFEIRSTGGFVFTSEPFVTTVIRDVTAPVVVDASFPGALQSADGRTLAGAASGGTLTLRIQVQDVVSAVAGLARIVTTDGAQPTPGAFDDVTSFGGLVSVDDAVGLGADGDKQVWVFARDRAGNVSAPARLDVLLDRVAPVGALRLTGTVLQTVGSDPRAAVDSTALTRTPTVAVAVDGASTDVVEIAISDDSSFVGDDFGPFVAGETEHELPAGDGDKTLFVKLRDEAGNESDPLQATITLDTQPPTAATILVNGGAAQTNAADAAVTLTLSASSQPAEMAFSTTGDFAAPTFETYATARSGLQLTAAASPGGDGLMTVFALFRDAAGNESPAVNDTIVLDRQAPQAAADVDCAGASAVVCVDSGAAFTSSVSVTLTLTASVVPPAVADVDKATEMQIAVDGVADTEPFVPYAPTTVALLPAGDCGTSSPACKTIAVRFRDAAGNTSAEFTDTIGLDTTPPSAPRIANQPVVTSAGVETIALSGAASDTFTVTYQLLGGQYPDWTSVVATDDFLFRLTQPSSTTAEGGDVYNLGVRAVDEAGNVSAEDFVAIVCDGNAPSAPTSLAVDERSGSASLRWDRAGEDDVTGYLVFYGYDPIDLNDTFAAEGPSPIFVDMPGGAANPSITLTGLTDNTPFYVEVFALDHVNAPGDNPNISPSSGARLVLPNPVTPVVVGGVARGVGTSPSIAVRGTRLYAMDGASLCAWDATNPSAIALIACKSDASFNANDEIFLYGRWAYLIHAGVTTRAVDIGRLGGSARGDPSTIPVITLDPTTQGDKWTDMAPFGTSDGGAQPYMAVARQNNATGELRLMKAPAAGVVANPLQPQLVTSALAGSSGGAVTTIDANLDLAAVVYGGGSVGFIHATRAPGTNQRFFGASGESIYDVKIETVNQTFDSGTGFDTLNARLYMGGSFGLRIHDVKMTLSGGAPLGITFASAPTTQIGGLSCTQLEVAAGYLYCLDGATGTADSLVIFALEPAVHVVGRLLVDNTKIPGAANGTIIRAFALTENMIYATLGSGDIAAIELVRPNRWQQGGSTGIHFEDVVVDRNTAVVLETQSGSLQPQTYDVHDPSNPTVVTATGGMGANCDTDVLRHARGGLFGHAVVAMCTGAQSLNGSNTPFSSVNPINGLQPQPERARPAADPSSSRSMIIDGHTAWIATSDGQIEAWSLARPGSPDGPAAVLTLPGSPSLSRPPALQDDRLVVVDDAGNAWVLDVSGTSATTPTMTLLQGPVALGIDDTSRFGDVEVRGGAVIASRALTTTIGTVGFVSVPFDPVTGALNFANATSKLRAVGTLAPMGDLIVGGDGTIIAGAPGNVAGVASFDPDNLRVVTSTQAVLAPWGATVIGPVYFGANVESGLETLILSR